MEEIQMPYVDQFLKEQMKLYKDASKYTLTNYRIDLKHFFTYTEGRFNVNIRTIKNWTEYLLTEKKEARSTINRRLSALRSYFKYLYNEEIIDTELHKKIVYVRKDPPTRKDVLKQEKIFKIMDNINDVRDRAIMETLYSTGMREGELSALNIGNIDFENELVIIIKGKGKKTRVVPIGKAALKYIKAYIASRKDPSAPLFLNNKYKRLGERGIYNLVKKYFDIPPHDLRHAFASHMIAKTGNVKAVSEMLGHASMKVTEEIYTHLTSDDYRNVYRDGIGR